MATLAGALYYSMAAERTRRGNAPEADAQQHAAHTPPTRAELDALFEYAPLALWFVYEETLVDMQRHASNHGFALLFGSTQSDVGKPAFAVARKFGGRSRGAGALAGGDGGGAAGGLPHAERGGGRRGGGASSSRGGGASSSPHGTHDVAARPPADATLDADDEGGGYAGVAVLVVRGTNDLTDAIMDARAEGNVICGAAAARTAGEQTARTTRRRRSRGGERALTVLRRMGQWRGRKRRRRMQKEEEEEVEVDGDAESGGTQINGRLWRLCALGGAGGGAVAAGGSPASSPPAERDCGYFLVLCGHSLGAGVAAEC